MAQSNGSAMNIDFAAVYIKLTLVGQVLDGESLIWPSSEQLEWP